MATKRKRPPVVLVEWEDARVRDADTWNEHEEEQKYEPIIMSQVGFLLYDGKEGVIVTHTWNDEMISPRDQIPRGMVRRIVKLRTPAVKPLKG